MDLWGFLTADSAIEIYKTLFDGILGASVGALVAMIVLRRTLNEQRTALIQQLDKQETLHREQLAVQREENARSRRHDIAAAFLNDLFDLVAAYQDLEKPNTALATQVILRMTVNQQRLQLEVGTGDSHFHLALSSWTQRIRDYCSKVGTPDSRPHADFNMLVAYMNRMLVAWAKSDRAHREHLADEWMLANKLVDRRGLDALIQALSNADSNVATKHG